MLRHLLLGAAALSLAALGAAGTPQAELSPQALTKLAPNLRKLSTTSPARNYIVQLDRSRSASADRKLAEAGAKVTRTYSHLSMAAIEADGSALRQVLALPEVRHVSADMAVKRASEFAIPAIGANLVHAQGVTGNGVGIAVIDSGVDNHGDLSKNGQGGAKRVEVGYDFTRNAPIRSGNDACGHGTMVAGLAAGNAAASTYQDKKRWTTRQFIGAAPQARIINLRILDRHGMGNVADAIAALNWCIANRNKYNIRVANLSFGHPPVESYQTDPLCQAAEAAWRAGIVVVAAAGNRGRVVPDDQYGGTQYGSINSPGNDPLVITVGATNDMGTVTRNDDWVATYSSRGPSAIDRIMKPDVVAPGNRIIGLRHPGSELERVAERTNLVPLSYYWHNPAGVGHIEYFVLSGTSMAAGFVSGVAALMIQNDPSLTPDTVKARLMLSARKQWRADGYTPNIFSRGAGLVDVDRALRCPIVARRPVYSPYVDHDGMGGYVIRMTASRTGEQTFWSDPAVWDNPALFANQALWADAPPGSTPPPPPPGETPPPPGGTPPPPPGGTPPPPPGAQLALWADQALWADAPPGSTPPPPPPPGGTPPPPGGTPPPPGSPPPPPLGGSSVWGDQALWADDPSNYQPGAPPAPDSTVMLWGDQALWADAPPGTVPPPPPPPPGGDPNLNPSQALWADDPPNNNPPPPPPPGGTPPPPGGTPPPPGGTPPPPDSPPPPPEAQALWADLFRLCITGDL